MAQGRQYRPGRGSRPKILGKNLLISRAVACVVMWVAEEAAVALAGAVEEEIVAVEVTAVAAVPLEEI